MSNEIFSISEAADYLGVYLITLRNWERKGLISAFRTPGGHRRFKKSDLDRIIGTNGKAETLQEVIKNLEKLEFSNGRRQTVNRIITDLKDMSKSDD